MPTIKNQLYRDFKEGKVITIFTRDLLDQTLHNITTMYRDGKFQKDHSKAARAFMIVLWASGGRPAEILNLTAEDIKRNTNNDIVVSFKTLKSGNPRSLTLSLQDKFVKEFWEYAASFTVPQMYLFHPFRSNRTRSDVKVYKKRKNPITDEIESYLFKSYEGKIYEIVSDKVFYYFKRWIADIFDSPDGHDIFPYYLRHSRLTVIADDEGNTVEDVRQFKGAKSYRSCLPYMHATPRQAKKLGKGALK
ncbi:MAG: hypothetical protein MUP17_04945 [candidate division Zixibacteria bacterium]|nr:hypothetical protein [candidate division Zixibacteria bacterium]